MSESLQEQTEHEVQHSGDFEDTQVSTALDNGCNPIDSDQLEQQPSTDTVQELLLDLKEKCIKSIEADNEEQKRDLSDKVSQPKPTLNLLCQKKEEEDHQIQSHHPTSTAVVGPPVPTTASTSAPDPNLGKKTTLTTGKPKEVAELERKKDDGKLGIYKALAIKLKKELVKTRDELAKLKDDHNSEIGHLKERVTDLEKTLESERITSTNTNATLEATVKLLRNQLQTAENDIESIQIDFDNYKTRATKILQQNQPVQSSSNKSFEEERYKQLKSLSEEQKSQIKDLSQQIEAILERDRELDDEVKSLRDRLREATAKVDKSQFLEDDFERLVSENKALKVAIEQNKTEIQCHSETENEGVNKGPATLVKSRYEQSKPDTSNMEYSATNGQLMPTSIVSRYSVLEDAQNQIDNLTKAYFESESTNSLLIEQVNALKEEVRRIQRGNERMELADNLEYLKNVIFKFLSLDHNQIEQKQRLTPVISTILKLSPEETKKLNTFIGTA